MSAARLGPRPTSALSTPAGPDQADSDDKGHVMKSIRFSPPTHRPMSRYFAALLAATAMAWGSAAQAHCDTVDGPLVSQARTALESGNLNPVLGWVRQSDEAEVRHVFEQAVSVRRAGGSAKELADRSFFETLVRVHRAGEGAPFTGLKPAGQLDPADVAADRALATGKLKPVADMVAQATERGLHQRFEAAVSSKPRDANDVEATRAHVGAYVQYVHYVEGLQRAATVGGDAHAEAEAPKAGGHQH
jgi:hypothetical protein